LDIIYPPIDPVRDDSFYNELKAIVPAQSLGLGPANWQGLVFWDDQGCSICALPLGALSPQGAGLICPRCQAQKPSFDKVVASLLYNEASKPLILGLKHADRLDLITILSPWLQRVVQPLATEIDIVVCVPLHWGRFWSRRYNQAAELARPVARYLDCDFAPSALVRHKATAPQGSRLKGIEGRIQNVRGVFGLSKQGLRAIKGRRVLIIDDVMTSGASLNACAQILKAAGATKVLGAVVARVGPS